MEGKTLSVIIPAYGEEDYLGICIESVVNQTYKNLEIILVDDGSPDRCPQICDEWALKDNRIKVIHKPNGGLVSARKAGIEIAKGDYIGYVDGDDWIEPTRYEKMVQAMEKNQVDIVMTGFQKDLFGKNIPYYNGIPEGVYRGKELEEKVLPTMIFDEETCQYGLYTYVWNKIFKRDKIFRYQMQVDNRIVIGEDAACVYPAILEADSIAITGECDYHYRQRMDSLLRRTEKGSNNVGQLQILYKYMSDILKQCKHARMVKQQLNNFFISYLLMLSDCLVREYPALGENFPYYSVKPNSKLVIYSAGAYGIHTYKQFCESEKYTITAWADPDYEKYTESSYNVVSLDEALGAEYDYFIIVSMDQRFIGNTKKILSEKNVDMMKVVCVDKQFIDKATERLREEGIIDFIA